MKILAFIPARGDSKGIPKKNLVLLNGKPLIQYTIEAAQKSKLITDIFISSDNDEIIDFSKSLGVDVSYKRPADIATDNSTTIDAVLHCLKWLEDQKIELPDVTALLQPTSPLRTSEDIDKAIERYHALNCESLMSVHRMLEHPYECIKTKKDSWDFLAEPKEKAINRQTYDDDFYFINGAIYAASTDFLRSKRAFTVKNETELFVMDTERGVDIDDLIDLKRAEFFIRCNSQNKQGLF